MRIVRHPRWQVPRGPAAGVPIPRRGFVAPISTPEWSERGGKTETLLRWGGETHCERDSA